MGAAPGNRLAEIRRGSLRLSQAGLARRMGKSQCTVSRLEGGKQKFTERVMALLKVCMEGPEYLTLLEAVIEKRRRP